MIISAVGLEAWWSFNNDSLHDFSGNGRDLANAVNVAFANAASGMGLSLIDRSVVRYAQGPAINFSAKTALSISWWCNKTTAATAFERIFDFGLSNVAGLVAVCPTGTDNAQIIFYRAGAQEVVPISNVFDATLRHYVLTFDLATKAWILYRNGAWFAGGNVFYTPVMPNTTLTIGNSNTPLAANTWIGLIDEVRLYSRVLTPTEALALYEDPAQVIPAPAPSVIPRSTDDLLLDNIVTILTAFSAAQAAIDQTAAFNVTRDQRRLPALSQLPLVNVWLDALDPEGSTRVNERETATVNLDLITRGTEDEKSSDEDAALKLAYLKEQVKSGLWALAQVDFGFAVGTIAVKGWPRWQTFQTEGKMPEEQIIGGRWSFSVGYEWTPSEVTRTALSELRITEKLKDYAPQAGVNIVIP